MDACGAVESWKRVTDPGTNKPKSFGFAEFADAEGVLTALATLNQLELYSQALLVKGNKDTIAYLVIHPLFGLLRPTVCVSSASFHRPGE